ncbi:MAG: MlaD family protein [Mariniblastus sp.]|nr:MlaD family protein [Mariniblastus sp.]MDG2183604.1 MlaD family protein [Mariniblastus sp.]
MDERILKFRVGILVVISMLILGILILTISGKPFFGSSYQISGETEDAAGISSGTPIKKFGLPIGRVTKVAPSPNGKGVTVWMSIQESDDNGQKQTIDTSKEMAVIGSESILGDVVLNIVPTKTDVSEIESEIIIKKNNPIEAVLGEEGAKLIKGLENLVDTDPKNKFNLRGLGEKIDKAAGKITEIIGSTDDKSNNLFTTIAKIQTTSDSITGMFQRQDKQPNFADAIANFDNLLGASGKEQTTFRGTLNGIDESIKDTSKSIQNTSDIAGNTLLRYQEIPNEWNGDVKAKVIEFIDNAGQTVKSLKAEPNSLIKNALTDEKLGTDFIKISKNIAEITRTTKDIVENKTIESILVKLDLLLTDLRFFGDSLARNPGSIVRGALRPRNDLGPKSSPSIIWEEDGYFQE